MENKNEAEARATYPAVEGGGSLMLAWQIRNKRVLVVGGGEASGSPLFEPLPLTMLRLQQAGSSTSSMQMQRSLSCRPEMG